MTDELTATTKVMLALALGLGVTWAIVGGGPRVARWTEGLIRFTARAAVRLGRRWSRTHPPAEQEPTDEEVEAADRAFHEVIMSGEWVTQEQAIRAALLAAQKVRTGQ